MPRRLPPKKCANPECEHKAFPPGRRNQKFCSKQCKDNYHNDLRREKNLNDYKLEKVLKENEKKLEKIYVSPLYAKHIVPEDLLEYEQVKLSVCSDTEINTKSNRHILWSHKYGIELMDAVPRKFIIHKREQI